LTLNTTDNPFANIEDPRVPYFFCNQLASASATSENAHEYRNGTFMSIFFASNGPNSARTNDLANTKLGIYANGGKYDNGSGGTLSLTTGNGVAPHKLITFATLKFMLAELALTGETSGDARTLLKEGIEASIAHVHTVAARQTGIPTISNDDRDDFVNAVLGRYDAADANGKLRILMTQKWISNFMSPVDSYNDIRRTGYPLLFDPQRTNNPGFGVNPTPTATSPGAVPLLNIASFPRSLYYPATSEIELNPNMQQKTDISVPLVFWDR